MHPVALAQGEFRLCGGDQGFPVALDFGGNREGMTRKKRGGESAPLFQLPHSMLIELKISSRSSTCVPALSAPDLSSTMPP